VSILFGQHVDRRSCRSARPASRGAATGAHVLTAVNASASARQRVRQRAEIAKVIGMLALIALAFDGVRRPRGRFDLTPAGRLRHASVACCSRRCPILFAYGGGRSCANIAAEIKDPARNLAKATCSA